MIDQIAPDFYEDREGCFCIIARAADKDQSHKFITALKRNNLDQLLGKEDVVVKIRDGIANQFMKIELAKRLQLRRESESYDVSKVTICRTDGDYVMVGSPVNLKKDPELRKKVKDGTILVRFNTFFRRGIAQNEIDQEMRVLMQGRTYSSRIAQNFYNLIQNDTD